LETIQESSADKSVPVEPLAVTSVVASAAASAVVSMASSLGAVPVPTRQSLPPKGSCWYCEKPLDSVRRFCGKSCADAFDEEAEYTR
jgi:hypothetical protein